MKKDLIAEIANICPGVDATSRFGYLGFIRNPSKMCLARR